MYDKYYQYWEGFFQQWKAGVKAINGWTDPDSLPLYNSDNKDLSSLYVPEPWWGNDGSSPLHSVVINLNPGAGEDAQTRNSINTQNFPSYVALVNSCYLPETIAWHLRYRAEPILTALNSGGYISNKDISLTSHLSIELIPWHTQSADNTYLKYCLLNLDNIFEYSIKFAAEQSRRIENDKLRNKVIVRMCVNRMSTLLKNFESIGQYSTIITSYATCGKGHYMILKFNSMPDVTFICIWIKGSNRLPKAVDLSQIISRIEFVQKQ